MSTAGRKVVLLQLVEVLANIGPIAYQLALPACIRVHNVFHVSLLKKYILDIDHVIDWNVIQVTRVLLFSLLIYMYMYMYMYEHGTNHVIEWIMILVVPGGYFLVQPVAILGSKVKLLRNR